jgi:hypothetical protein
VASSIYHQTRFYIYRLHTMHCVLIQPYVITTNYNIKKEELQVPQEVSIYIGLLN